MSSFAANGCCLSCSIYEFFISIYVIVTLTSNVFNPNVCLCISFVLALFTIFNLKCQRTTHIAQNKDNVPV